MQDPQDPVEAADLQAELDRLNARVHGIAHDLSNLLMMIEAAGRAEAAAAAALATDLVRQLQALVEPWNPRLHSVEVNEIVTQLLPLLRGAVAQGASIEWRPSTESTVVEVSSASQLEQIVLNLVTNAAEAMPSGGRIALETVVKPSSSDDPSGFVDLIVCDQGPGFSAAALPRAFEAGFSTKSRGTGIGLATVRRVVIDLGGIVKLSNPRCGGAHVLVRLPLKTGT